MFILLTSGMTIWYAEVSFWPDYIRSGTLMFKVKMAGLSRYYRSAKRGWFVLVFVIIMLQAYSSSIIS